MTEKYIEQLEAFTPCCEQEETDKEIILAELINNPDVLSRDDLRNHMTVSAFVVNKEHTKMLMAFHRIYNSWAWLGGHADGEENPITVALKEANEETGITSAVPVSDGIFSVEILTVNGHEKRGKYVPSHLHLNFTYLLEADENESIRNKEDENSDVAWFTFEEALNASTEEWIKERIYKKLFSKLQTTK